MSETIQCFDCKHFKINKITELYYCKAFPKGIPADIEFNQVDHTKPYKGDNGIRFEPKDDVIPEPADD